MSTQIREEGCSQTRKEEEELWKLEEEVQRMAEKVLEYRTTLPDQLASSLTSLLASQRPVLPDMEAEATPGSNSEAAVFKAAERTVEFGGISVMNGENQEGEKIELLKQKIASNASTMQITMQRMKEYMSRMDKLDASFNGTIHPAFKRKRTS